ncbi:MAG: amidase [Frankiaceae bacterium]|nr:amidase [Frankiaceae bacterium]MBV9869314.1 amidase [Frankiaceae bacterium]
MSELHDLTLLEQAAEVRQRSVSPVELVEHYLERIDRLNDALGAFVTVTADLALDAAKRAEAAIGDEALPPLHGVPTAIKDLNLTAGVPTRFGTTAMPPVDAGVDDFMVSKLKSAGLISLGKTNTPEFGLPCYTEPDVAPPARTPWDLDRSAGGSSGGAAAAVAGGLVPAAQGSDGGGSIRIPSSVCGLFGIKPSRGRVSSAPVSAEISGLATNGPIARTVRDAAALLDAMAGPAPSDWLWAPPPPVSFLTACDDPPSGLRIGRYATPVVGQTGPHPDCLAAYEAATELLTDLGHTVVEHTPTFMGQLVDAFETIWSAEFLSLPLDPAIEPQLRPLTRWIRDRGKNASGSDVYAALATLRMAARTEIEATQQYDAILTPTLAQPPAFVGQLREDADPAADFEAQKQFTPFTAPYNMSGQPAVSVPLHWTAAGLPIGIQLVGRPCDELTLVRLSAQLEAAAPWAHRRPECW